MTIIEALVTPSVMRWARESAGLKLKEAAKNLKRPTEDIVAWETGIKRPTISQARKASELYKRPLAVFYLPEPPKDFETLRDFRRISSQDSPQYSSKLLMLIRTAVSHQQWSREFLISENTQPLSFVGTASLDSSPEDAGRRILAALNLSPNEQCNCKTRSEALRLWISRAEKSGVFIFRERGIDLHECRGLIISDDIAPFIYLNSEDAKAAQMFTLAHELVHLLLNISGVSNLAPKGHYPSDEEARIETFCNKAAAEAILPDNKFNLEWNNIKSAASVEIKIESLSKIFKISEEAIARRLLERGVINRNKYESLRKEYQARWIELRKSGKKRMKETTGGPSYYVKMVSSNGYAFTQTVVSAYMSGAVSGREASSLLNVKVNNIIKLANAVGIPSSGERRG